MSNVARTPKPGLAKVRVAALIARRRVELVALVEGRWREVFEQADVVSEGQSREEPDGVVYYGTTSLLLLVQESGGHLPSRELELLAALLRRDPHTRVRALRIAQREASSRATGPLGTVHADVTIEAATKGILITVDVTARLRRTRAATTA